MPVIAFNAGNHDDTAITRIGPVLTFMDPVSINVVAANASHPALGGKTGTINWTNFGFAMQGLGSEHSGGKVLARVADPTNPSVTHPAIYVIDEGEALLGGFAWDPEGDRYVVGADLDHTFGGGPPRQLNIPVNLAGRSNVQLTVGLAATDADFEPGDAAAGTPDYLAISIDPNGTGAFELLAEFTGNAAKSFEEVQVEDGARVLDANNAAIFTGFVLSNQMFRDYTVDLPAGGANAVFGLKPTARSSTRSLRSMTCVLRWRRRRLPVTSMPMAWLTPPTTYSGAMADRYKMIPRLEFSLQTTTLGGRTSAGRRVRGVPLARRVFRSRPLWRWC